MRKMQLAGPNILYTKDWYIRDDGNYEPTVIIQRIRDYLPDIKEVGYDYGFSRHITNKKRTKDVCISRLSQGIILNPHRIGDVINFLK